MHKSIGDRYKMFNKQLLSIALFSILIWKPAIATEYIVRSAQEIEDVCSYAQPGDVLIMANGVWVDQEIEFECEGALNDSIILRAETPGQVILTGGSNLRIHGRYLKVEGLWFLNGASPSGGVIEFRDSSDELAEHCRLTNCTILYYNPENEYSDYKWVSLYGAYNRVDHCHFEGKNHSAATLVVWFKRVTVPPAHYHRIDHNYFGYRPNLGRNGGETIRIGTSTYSMNNSRTIVEYNLFERCNGEIEIISSKSCENIYRYNTFYECEGTLTLRHGNRCEIYGNFFIGNQKPMTGGVRVIGEDHYVYNNYFEGLYGLADDWYCALPIMNGVPNSPLNRYFQVKNAVIAFNTFVDCPTPIALGVGGDSEKTLPPLDCTIANNLVDECGQIFTVYDDPVNMTWEGNIMMGESLGMAQPSGIEWTDPQMSLAADNLWRPATSSPVLDAAAGEYTEVIDDMDGQVRDANSDVGADEYSVSPIIRRPLTAADVGSDWLDTVQNIATLAVATEGTGEVLLDPSGGIYLPGTVVQLTALPGPESVFQGWTGDLVSNANPDSIEVNGHMHVTAIFADPAYYTLGVWVNGRGNVSLNPTGGEYQENTLVSLTAIPDPGWVFNYWSINLSGSNNPDTLLMDSNKSVAATFTEGTDVATIITPTTYLLNQNYPNPFNAQTTISFSLERSGWTTLTIYDSTGEEVDILVDEELSEGMHRYVFDASQLASGVYIYKIRSDSFYDFKKMMLLK